MKMMKIRMQGAQLFCRFQLASSYGELILAMLRSQQEIEIVKLLGLP